MIETVELAPGYRISRIIRGGWQQNRAAGFDARQEEAFLHAFVEAGVTAFETADTYRGLDAAIKRALAVRANEGLALPRIHTRITLPADIGGGLAAASSRLGQPLLDLVQLQDWRLDRPAIVTGALTLHAERERGRLLHYGFMNVDADLVDHARERGACPIVVQAQASLIDRRAFATLAPYMRAHGMGLLAFGPLAGGFIAKRWLGQRDPGFEPTPASPFHREYRIVIEAFGGWALFQRLLQTLAEIAFRHAVDLSAIALRWVLDQPGVAAVLAGASTPNRIESWLKVFTFSLSELDRAQIDTILNDAKGPLGPVGGLERDMDGPFARAIAASERARN